MLDKGTLASEIAQITTLDSLSFERQLNNYLTQTQLLPILADLLASDFPHPQKILAASAINRTITHRLDLDYKRWPLIWEQLCREVLMHPEVHKMEWRHFGILTRGLKQLMEDMAEDLCKVVNPLFEHHSGKDADLGGRYEQINIKVKVLLFQSFVETETTKDTRYVFLRENVQAYLKQVLEFVCWCHEGQPSSVSLRLQKSILSNLSLLLNTLEVYLNDSLINELLVKLSLNDVLFQFIVEELLYSPGERYVSTRKQEFSPQRVGELVVFVGQGPSLEVEQHLNEVKGYTFAIFMVLLKQYDKKSQLSDFDRYKHLNLMQNLAPLILQKLAEIISKKQINEQNTFIAISLLQFLCLASKFNFLLQFFDSNLQKMLFQVCFPLLAADEFQIQEYNENSDSFIIAAEEAIELLENYTKTLKNTASHLLQQIIDTLDGSLLFIIQTNISIVKYVLTDQIQTQLLQIINKFEYKVSIEASLMILTLFSEIYLRRRDLLDTLKGKLLELREIANLENIDLARLFILLAYNYQTIYATCQDQGTKFIVLASEHLESRTAISQCALLLFENCIKLGFGQEIWDNLLKKLQNTETIGVFRIFKKIVTKMLESLAASYVNNLINKLVERFIAEYKNANQNQLTIKTNLYMTQILNILQQISQNRNYLRNQPSIIDSLWAIFDLFEFVEKIEFQDNILRIFNYVLTASKTVDRKFFRFLNYFPEIHLKSKGFSEELLYTFTKLLTRGREHFINEEQRPSTLQNLIQSLKCCYSLYKKQQSLVHFCIFFQYIFLQYSSLLKKDHQFFEILYRYYHQNKQSWQPQTVASVINLFLIAETQFGGLDLNVIAESRIQIFQGYQGQIFALGLRKLVEKYHQSGALAEYLRYSMRLLHYIREINLAQAPPKRKYYSPNFEGLKAIDPFMQICGSLDFLKKTLDPHRYDSLIEELRSEISLGEIKDLLSRRIVDKSLRTIYKVRQD